jgi:excinuclease ABC subunit A
MDTQNLVVRGAREHNLRGVNLDLPRNSLICFTGVSGSGKSSLAFDTLYAEGQRRYVESLSSYARQFLGQLPKPDVDYVGGLSPAISIQQKTAGRNPRSTVGTVTEVQDFLRVLFARLGTGHCPTCDRPIVAQTREMIVGRILSLPEGTRFLVMAPVVRGQKGEFKDFFADMSKRGYVRARVDGQVVRLTDDLRLDKRIKHNIEVVIDRLQIGGGDKGKQRTRIAEAVDQALAMSDGAVIISTDAVSEGDHPETRSPTPDLLLSAKYACTNCDKSFDPPSPQLFSFNNPQGMCLECDGLGTKYTFDPDLLIPDQTKSVHEGAIVLVGPLKGMGRWRKHIYEGVGKSLGIDLTKPWKSLPKQHKDWLLGGSGDSHIVWEWKQRNGVVWKHGGKWEGFVPQFLAQFKKAAGGPRRAQLEKYMRVVRCPGCDGQRLNPLARASRVGDKTLVQLGAMAVGDLVPWFVEYEKGLGDVQRMIAGELLKEILARLGFLLNVGLHYLSLDRSAPTLSGGEAQRIRLAGQIGSGLVGVLYILDEPSIGLHPRDNARLLASLERLRDMGNTVLVVEHDEDTMKASDVLVDFGPGPGVRGGHVVSSGPPAKVLADPKSLTGQYLSGAKEIAIPKERRKPGKDAIRIVGATHHNLKKVTAEIPLGVFVVVTGVSGSGKSSLINDVLKFGIRDSEFGMKRRAEEKADEAAEEDPDELEHAGIRKSFDRIEGCQHIDKVIDIDQSAIGRTPRSNPATYIKLFDEIRSLYAAMADAKVRGYQPGRFSFNVTGGRCESCLGNGSNRLEMDFLADVWITCPVCEGNRFNRETLQVKYRGKSIRDVLEMEVAEALAHFEHVPKINAMLQTLHDVGLDYVKLGQPSPTLSGGEAQRIKLAKELCRKDTGKTLYILDEPTTGLHFDDVRKLLEVLHGFVERGNTVLVIEHNLDVIKTADWLIDMGPDGGKGGGEVVAVGTPETVAKAKRSYTGQALLPILFPAKSPRTGVRGLSKNGSAKSIGLITHIEVQGAGQHNLKGVDAKIPREKMTVFCGPSGSGKSSLALDTIYAEGQRRYVESLSSYARQFLGQIQKPRVDRIDGLSPAISIEQKTTSRSPRSTVGTITEIYDYLRILFARLGQRYCPKCEIPVATQSADQIIEQILALPEGTKLYVLAPVDRMGQEKYDTIFEDVRKGGYSRVRIDGTTHALDALPEIDHRRKHAVEVVVDRNVVKAGTRTRIAEAIEQALELGKGVVRVALVDAEKDEKKWKVTSYSQHLACGRCGTSYEPLNPHHYSFNGPLGWCNTCEGLGVQRGANVNLLIRDGSLSVRAGAIGAWPELKAGSPWLPFAEAIAGHSGFSLDTPYDDLTPGQKKAILHGTGETWMSLDSEIGSRNAELKAKAKKKSDAPRPTPHAPRFQYKGLFPALDEAARVSFSYRMRLEHLVDEVPCTSCKGGRLRPDAAATRFADHTMGELCELPLTTTLHVFETLKQTKEEKRVAGELLREIRDRTKFLVDVGLDYLTLGRPGPTLSGGEAQRIRLASQIGSGLTGVLYVLDEPTIGLHPRDNDRLLGALKRLRDLGNTLLVVEHDREVISEADYLLDFGPGAGDRGGEVTASGPPKAVLKSKQSLTGDYLSGRKAILVPSNRRIAGKLTPRPPSLRRNGEKIAPVSYAPDSPAEIAAIAPGGAVLSVIGARQNNLKNIDVHLPLGAVVSVTGVSGSGKSSLVTEVLYHTLARKLNRAQTPGAAHDEIKGLENVDKIINVDQDPIGNSPSSNPATYTGLFDLIRELFARLPESKLRGYHPRRFSFNQKGGRCEACEGMGLKKIEMHFLPDVWVECDTCHGKRYNPETLLVTFHGKTISDVLDLRVSEALELFGNIPKIRVILQTLADVGLDYMALGQPAPTMSGGEAQRVKLAAELARPNTGRTLYVLDEPTTGLHFDDVRKLLAVLHRLADLGNSVVLVEHNLDVIKTSDWVIDIGPEAGANGGRVVAQGTPEQVVAQFDAGAPSQTAKYLKPVLEAGPLAEREVYDPKAARQARLGDIDITQVGQGQKLPWEADGERWHTQDRVTSTGKRCKWDGAVLSHVVNEIQKAGGFSETNWAARTVVEIAAETKSYGWFFHGLTGHEAYLKLCFRVKRNAFKEADLAAKLALKPLSDTPGLEGYARDGNRVECANGADAQSIVVVVHKLADVTTAGFKDFLAMAIASFKDKLGQAELGVEGAMPWKKDGEAWHTGPKGFPPGRVMKWDRAAFPALIATFRSIDPDLTIKWDSREHILITPSGMKKSWAWCRTKESSSLIVNLVCPKGRPPLAPLEGVCKSAEVASERSDGSEVLKIEFTTPDQVRNPKLKAFLTGQLTAFRNS